jgi:hypothetical protein
MPSRAGPISTGRLREDLPARLRLYIARSTPNSVRAEHNLSVVLARLPGNLASLALEVIDVFAYPKLAITDGVVVTPTLIGLNSEKRIVLMGDLSDQAQLHGVLQDLLGRN